MTNSVPSVALISLERWDDIWRRNQHLSSELIKQGLCRDLLFVSPPSKRPIIDHEPQPGIRVIEPHLPWPAHYGGLRGVAGRLERCLEQVDVLWVNHATLGALLLDGRPAVYDVTDDWREARNSRLARRQLIAAESRLANRARTIVCSETLRERWRSRYHIDATVVRNAVDAPAVAAARARELTQPGPHVGYIGTLQAERLDIALIQALASATTASVHLVGPVHLDERSLQAVSSHKNVYLHGPVPATEVPSWLQAMDVLLLPHIISSFTLSLDAIKAHEYLATARPIVATPTSGFQELSEPGVITVPSDRFVDAVLGVLRDPPDCRGRTVETWAGRAREFARAAWGKPQ